MKRWQFWLGVLISALFLWWALGDLQLEEFWLSISTANYFWLLPGIAVYFVAVWVRAWRWHFLIAPIRKVPTRVMFPITTIGYMGNNIYPLRAGEILRAVVLKKREAVPVSASLATILVERIFDGVVMLAFVFVNLPQLARVSGVESGFVGDIQELALWGSAAFFGALLVFLLAAMFPRITLRISLWAIARFVPRRWRERSSGIAAKFLEGLAALRSPWNALMVFFTSVVIWLLETVKYWFVMQAFDFTVSFFALMLLNGIANLATTIPSAPGYIGTWEAVTRAVLVAFKVPAETALGYAVVLHVALWLPITLLGLYYTAREGIKWNRDLGRLRSDDSP